MYHDNGRVDAELPDGLDLQSFKIYLNENWEYRLNCIFARCTSLFGQLMDSVPFSYTDVLEYKGIALKNLPNLHKI